MKIDMTKGNVAKVLIKFTIPVLIGDLFQQMYNLVDTIIVGKFVGTDALAAVGATGTVVFLIVGFCIALANGFAVVSSQKFGARDEEGLRRSFMTGIYLTLIICGLVTLGSYFYIDRLLVLMNTPTDIFDMSYDYIFIITTGVLATGLYNYFSASLRAIGNSKVPLYFLFLSSALNVVLDLVFILKFDMKVVGAARATIYSQIVSAVCCLIYILVKEPSLRPKLRQMLPSGALVKQQLYIGIPMALQNAITASGTMVGQAAMNTFGSDVVAACTAAFKVRQLYTQPLLSMGQGVAMFTGQNYGARDMDRVRTGATRAMIMTTGYALLAALAINLLLRPELSLFIKTAEEVEYLLPWARTATLTCSIPLFFLGFIFVFRSAIQGVGMSTYAMLAGIIELVSRIIMARIATSQHIFLLACFCDPFAWVFTGPFCLISFYIIVRKKKRRMLLDNSL